MSSGYNIDYRRCARNPHALHVGLWRRTDRAGRQSGDVRHESRTGSRLHRPVHALIRAAQVRAVHVEPVRRGWLPHYVEGHLGGGVPRQWRRLAEPGTRHGQLHEPPPGPRVLARDRQQHYHDWSTSMTAADDRDSEGELGLGGLLAWLAIFGAALASLEQVAGWPAPPSVPDHLPSW